VSLVVQIVKAIHGFKSSMLDALLEMAKPQRRIDEDIPDKPGFSLLLNS
jgi:hypothetical protein